MNAVSFCDNHDTDRSQPIVNDKLLAYAYIMTHEGVPCIFWKDYYNYGLAMPDSAMGIDKLCQVHRDYAGGETTLLYSDGRLYVAQRGGYQAQKGLVVVINTDTVGCRPAGQMLHYPARLGGGVININHLTSVLMVVDGLNYMLLREATRSMCLNSKRLFTF